MRKWMTSGIFSIILAAAIGLGATVSAGAGQAGAAMPPGSYLQTCQNLNYNQQSFLFVRAMHRDPVKPGRDCAHTIGAAPSGNGTVANSTLIVSNCNPGADIANINGKLQCQALAGTWGNGGAVPYGSYQQSCDQWNVQTVYSNGKTFPRLAARCKTFGGTLPVAEATLDLSQCSMTGDIQNHMGQLLCSPATSPTPPSTQAAASPTPGTCKPSFVPRQVNAEDHVCVTTQERQQVVADNSAAPQHTV